MDKTALPPNLYPYDIYKKLEFDKVLDFLEKFCQSSLGLALVKNISLSTDFKHIDQLLREVNEFKHLITSGYEFPALNIIDLTPSLTYLKIQDSVLKETQIFELLKNLLIVQDICLFFDQQKGELKKNFPYVYALFKELPYEKLIINRIKGVIDDEGKIRNSASKELSLIRNQILLKYREIESRFKSLMSEYRKRGWLTDEGETIRNGRRVVSLQAEYKRSVKGIITDESPSGKITFIEPEETLQLNNELFELQQEEKREIYRILKALCADIRPYADQFLMHQSLLAYADFVMAKSRMALELGAEMPQLCNERIIELHNAYHPLLFLLNRKSKRTTVPLSLRLSIADRILVISGPNAGGKSVALKTISLLQLMIQAGMLVPASPVSMMGIFHTIALDMGDEQSLENDLSTYSSRLKNMRWFVEMADHKSLIFIDEFGSGTDPKFGGAIAEAILIHLHKKFAFGVITTHYSNIKLFAAETKGIVNGAMSFDHKNLAPLYMLELGKPGSSFAFELAKKIAMPEHILELAKEKVGTEYREFDHLLGTMQLEKNDIVQREAALRKEEEKFNADKSQYLADKDEWNKSKKKILLETKEKSLQTIIETNKKMENMMRELKEGFLHKEKIAAIKAEIDQEKEQLKNEVVILKNEVKEKVNAQEFAIGDRVKLLGSEQYGEIIELNDGKAYVQFGLMKSRLNLNEIAKIEVKQNEKKNVRTSYDTFQNSVDFQYTIDVRGKRREEALLEIEAWLDKALMINADQLKIIHGRGDGILKRAIRTTFKSFPSVRSIKDEDPQYGGDSISIIELG
jgi:DNA mismatch repair protein MutS2